MSFVWLSQVNLMSLQSAVWYLPRSQTPRYNAHSGIFLHLQYDAHTAESDSTEILKKTNISAKSKSKIFQPFYQGPRLVRIMKKWGRKSHNTHQFKGMEQYISLFSSDEGNKILKKVTKKRRDQRNDKSVCYRKSYFSKFLR